MIIMNGRRYSLFFCQDIELPWSIRIELALHIAKGILYLNSQGKVIWTFIYRLFCWMDDKLIDWLIDCVVLVIDLLFVRDGLFDL